MNPLFSIMLIIFTSSIKTNYLVLSGPSAFFGDDNNGDCDGDGDDNNNQILYALR